MPKPGKGLVVSDFRAWRKPLWVAAVFLVCFFLPVGVARFDRAIVEALHLVRWYAREHVVLCLLPAFFIAGAIAVFVSQSAVMKYLGAGAHKGLAYGVASVSGTLLAVCSCTVLPLFAGIYRMGAGLGPATAFLYAGPAVNVLAIALTARVLGLQLGIARAVGAVVFSVVIGLLMHVFFRREEQAKAAAQAGQPEPEVRRPLWQQMTFFFTLVAILVFANWGPSAREQGLWHAVYQARWVLTAVWALVLGLLLVRWFAVKAWQVVLAGSPAVLLAVLVPDLPVLAFSAGLVGLSVLTGIRRDECGEWFAASGGFAMQILPLLFAGVLVAGLLLGRPESSDGGLIPSAWVAGLVGGNSLSANLLASVVGAFMYFATLTEVPILQGLLGKGMGQGPALALLLAGPALSLPNMLVIRSVMGTRKTLVFVVLVIVMATLSGWLFGILIPSEI